VYKESSGEGEQVLMAENTRLRLDIANLDSQLAAADLTIQGLR
jgi:hypothetical protein